MTVENVGFFRELPHGDAQGASLREGIGKGDEGIRDHVARYLANGSVLATTGERVFDVLQAEREEVGTLALQTDGRWVWPADLAYYVTKYNVVLPTAFVDWARAAEWVPPQLSVDELTNVE